MAYHQMENFFKMIHLYLLTHNVDTSANELNNDLYQINKWTFQWKTSFNLDQSKQAQEVVLSRKTQTIFHLSLSFSKNITTQTPYQKHLRIFLDARLTFDKHLRVVITNVN